MSLDILTVISYDRHYFNLNYEITKKLNDYSHNWIVVENYSKDKHGAFDPDKKITKIEEDNIKYVEGIDQDSLNVRVIKKKNLSYSLNPQRSIFHSKGLSLGLKNSNSKYLLIIDPDFFVIRKNWIKNIIEYMEEKNIDLFSSPYHPVKDWTKPFTPCVYFMILNTEKINKNKLNFNPPEINEILNKKKILKKNLFENNPMFYWVLLIGFLFRDKNRYQIRKLGDVGHNLLNFKEINLYLTQPAISKIKDLKLNRLILDSINFKINAGQIFGMLGPNGVGKSTIFNIITGLINPKSGKIKIQGNDVTQYPIYLRSKKFKVGYVPQYGGYFNDLTLLDNLNAISEIVIENKNLRKDKISYLISKFQLDNLKDIKAKFLSGGQKKKLVIALSLLSDPKVLLLDECFAALDVLTIKMLQETIVNLQQENKITICICDHQARDLLACVDVAMILSNGKIVAQDTPTNLIKNINARDAYFGDSFKIN